MNLGTPEEQRIKILEARIRILKESNEPAAKVESQYWERVLNKKVQPACKTEHLKFETMPTQVPTCNRKKDSCGRSHTCSILGQCVFEHPLVLANRQFAAELKNLAGVKAISKAFTRYYPDLWKQ